jgi:hypothetical protein
MLVLLLRIAYICLQLKNLKCSCPSDRTLGPAIAPSGARLTRPSLIAHGLTQEWDLPRQK